MWTRIVEGQTAHYAISNAKLQGFPTKMLIGPHDTEHVYWTEMTQLDVEEGIFMAPGLTLSNKYPDRATMRMFQVVLMEDKKP